jgi:hypothetical protein
MRRLAVVLVSCGACLAGCESFRFPWDKGEQAAEVRPQPRPDKPLPRFVDVARQYNQRVANLDRISAWSNIKLTYFDEDGKPRTEDPEGRLQIIRPAKLALTLGKAGQTLFWFGSDPEKYWWIDLTDKAKPVAAVGRHESFDDQAAQRIGLAIQPLDLIRLMGVVPINTVAPGATQWSADGKQLGVTSALENRGFQRIWMDPATLTPQEIEIFDINRRLVMTASHEGSEPVEITRKLPSPAGPAPRVPGRVFVNHFDSGTEVRLTLTGVKDGPISERAFDLAELLKRYQVERVVDVDTRKP